MSKRSRICKICKIKQDEESKLEIFFGLWYTLNVRPRERDNNKIGQAQLGSRICKICKIKQDLHALGQPIQSAPAGNVEICVSIDIKVLTDLYRNMDFSRSITCRINSKTVG
ncbi:hypothetical protein C6495_11595 [Candidatus Poribacteria bacterium]|nr:MAG: hypothetical protein C6495_11595 [Candidatus Poribacteria bacterium]